MQSASIPTPVGPPARGEATGRGTSPVKLSTRAGIYGAWVLLGAAGVATSVLEGPTPLAVGLLVLAMVYGIGAAVYLAAAERHADRQRGPQFGGIHPRHGLLNDAPATVTGLVATIALCAAMAAYGLWAVSAEIGDFSVETAEDVSDLFAHGVVLLLIAACALPSTVVSWLVRRHWGTVNPPARVYAGTMVAAGVLSLISAELTVQWVHGRGLPENIGAFVHVMAWLPVVMVGLAALAAAFRYVMVSAWQARLNEQTLRADAAEQRRQLAEAQLAMLQAQVEPHFLYNTLASVQYLVRKDAAAADFMLTQLIRYLRHAMPKMRQPLSTLQQEFELADAFLQIARMRMGGRLQVQVELEEALHDTPFPPLVLQTLVENALKHGVEPKLGPVQITVSAMQRDDALRIEVLDNGVGLGRAPTAGTGTGLASIRSRLAHIYGDRALLSVTDLPMGGVRATVQLHGALDTGLPTR
jgi:signal transduction histidine kinase